MVTAEIVQGRMRKNKQSKEKVLLRGFENKSEITFFGGGFKRLEVMNRLQVDEMDEYIRQAGSRQTDGWILWWN